MVAEPLADVLAFPGSPRAVPTPGAHTANPTGTRNGALTVGPRAPIPPRALPLPQPFAAVPGVARVAIVAGWRAAGWTLGTSVSAVGSVMRRSLRGEAPTAVLQGVGSELRAAAWRALGLSDDLASDGVPEIIAPQGATPQDLRARGTELLRKSNDVHVVEDTHPAFARILSEITPDEARILRFIFIDGPQPSIDVRTNRPLGIGSELIAGGLNMIGEHAGCRNVDRIHPYLTNLFRLGLIQFSKEQVSNPQRYQLVEAQPKVTAELRRAGRWPRTVQRSIRLTPFGAEFCRTCLPMPTAPRARR